MQFKFAFLKINNILIHTCKHTHSKGLKLSYKLTNMSIFEPSLGWNNATYLVEGAERRLIYNPTTGFVPFWPSIFRVHTDVQCTPKCTQACYHSTKSLMLSVLGVFSKNYYFDILNALFFALSVLRIYGLSLCDCCAVVRWFVCLCVRVCEKQKTKLSVD